MAIDPVCGMTVEPAKAAGSADHGGMTYYFCCAGCLGKFKVDPVRYAAPAHSGTRRVVRIGRTPRTLPIAFHCP